MSSKISGLLEKLEKNPAQVFHRYSLAQAYFDAEDFQSACSEFEKCLLTKPDWMMAALSIAKAYMELGEIDRAIEKLKLTIDLAKEQGHDDPAMEATELLKECGQAS